MCTHASLIANVVSLRNYTESPARMGDSCRTLTETISICSYIFRYCIHHTLLHWHLFIARLRDFALSCVFTT